MPIRASMAAGRWQTLTLAEQLGNVGSEVERAARWHGNNQTYFDNAAARAVELMDLTLTDPRWRGRRRIELARTRELLGAAIIDEGEPLADFAAYFFHFAMSARSHS